MGARKLTWNENRQYYLFCLATPERADLVPFYPDAMQQEQFEAFVYRHAMHGTPVVVSTRAISQRERRIVYQALIKNEGNNQDALIKLQQVLNDQPKIEKVKSLDYIGQ